MLRWHSGDFDCGCGRLGGGRISDECGICMRCGVGLVEAELVLCKAVFAEVGAEELQGVLEACMIKVDVVVFCKFLSWRRHFGSSFAFGLRGRRSDRGWDWGLRGGHMDWQWGW